MGRQAKRTGVHPVDRHLGARLRAMRLERRLTQKTLAAHLGLSQQQLQKYERGVNRISAAALYEIAERLGAPIGAFFSGLAGAAPAGAPRPPHLSRLDALYDTHGGVALAEAYLDLPPTLQSALLDFVRSLPRPAAERPQ